MTTYKYQDLNNDIILNIYLYGQETIPTTSWYEIPTHATETTTTINVDAVSYMQEGAGRYAKPVNSEIVQKFMAGNGNLVAKEYSISEIQNALNLSDDSKSFIIQQYEYDTGSVDFFKRVFTFNTTSFVIKDNPDLKFIVNPDGSRIIKNIQVLPYDDNFDFNSSDNSTKY
jgi:hypothetical protein